MKICIILCFFTLSVAYGQKTQLITMAEIANPFVQADALIQFNEQNTPVDTVYILRGHDARYQSIVSVINLGVATSLSGVRIFLEECLTILEKEQLGTNLQHKGVNLQITGYNDQKKLAIFGMGDDADGYVIMTKAQIKRLIGKF
jgi:hypothetical protein